MKPTTSTTEKWKTNKKMMLYTKANIDFPNTTICLPNEIHCENYYVSNAYSVQTSSKR